MTDISEEISAMISDLSDERLVALQKYTEAKERLQLAANESEKIHKIIEALKLAERLLAS